MALNEFERRFLEVTQNDLDLRQLVRELGTGRPPEYFGYPLQIGSAADPLVAGATQQGIINIQADAWYLLQYINAAVILPNGSTWGDLSQFTASGNIALQITDTGAGQDLYNVPSGFSGSPAINLAGSTFGAMAGVPYVFPTPRLIPPNTNIKVEVTQIGNTALTNPAPVGFYLMLNGARIPIGGD